MESSQFFFPIGAPKQFKMIVKLIRQKCQKCQKCKKLRGKKREGTRRYAICELFYVEWGRQTIWKDFNCVGFFLFFSFNFEKEIMFMSLDPTILYYPVTIIIIIKRRIGNISSTIKK